MNWRCRLFGHVWAKAYRVGRVCNRCLMTTHGGQYPMEYGWPPMPEPFHPPLAPPPKPRQSTSIWLKSAFSINSERLAQWRTDCETAHELGVPPPPPPNTVIRKL